ncbi:alpha/beta hydrolase [Mesonia ostreae]|uniref:Esterase n=1 Tax=Mesonia ostreae TaxID=861110 RepID=A0ABU2KK45_9FLAO|nr:esterase [Mesonia ostreae]MDT0295112.1 esterase [Mesonia ostreae]
MTSIEKQVTYQTTNSYSSLNKLTSKTKNIWICCHGLGYLSRYFIQYFKALDEDENYIIAPQAQAKYYQSSNFKHVGASWLTKEDTALEMQNVLKYLDAVFAEEVAGKDKNLILFGYSQGVSIITRWMAAKQLPAKALILHSGSIPPELQAEQFDYLAPETPVFLLYGNKDQYITEEKLAVQKQIATRLFGNRLQLHPFKGKHEVKPQLVADIINKAGF